VEEDVDISTWQATLGMASTSTNDIGDEVAVY